MPIPISRSAILKELEFLSDLQPGLSGILESEKDLMTFVRSIYGLITPFYVPRTNFSFGDDPRDELRLGNLHRDKIHTRDDLADALSIVTTIRQRAERDSRRRPHEFARKQARGDIETAFTARDQVPAFKVRGISFTDKKTAQNALAVIYALTRDKQSILFHVEQFALSRRKDSLRLEVPLSDELPISEFQLLPTSTHRERIKLILSFLKASISWADQGVVLQDFRPDVSKYQGLYLAGSDSQFIMGDLGVLGLSGDLHRLLDEEWLPGPLLAKAFRYLYYGKINRRDIENTRLYRAPWNDNMVRDVARWLDSVPFINIKDLLATVEVVFRDELDGSPLIFSKVDEQFIHDAMDAGFKFTADVLTDSRPNYLSKDRGHWKYPLLYTSWRDAQIGSFEESPSVQPLYRYKEYNTRRWASARDRDWGRAVEMRAMETRDRVLAVFCQESDMSDVCSKVFGVSQQDYVSWLEEQKYGAKHIPVSDLPAVLKREENLFLYRRGKLDALRNKRFGFKIKESKFSEDLSSNLVTLRVSDGQELLEHLKELGYRPKTVNSLSVEYADSAGLKVISSLFRLRANDRQVVIDIIPPPSAELLPQQGYFHLTDIGTKSVMKEEDSIFREFALYLSSRDTIGREIPTGRAWQWIEPVFGPDRPLLTSNKRRTPIGVNSKTNDQITSDVLRSILEKEGPYWHVLTGAAGTGKTHVTASIAFKYLESTKTREYPPRRVLVVSAAHFGVDNFVRVFLKVCDGQYIPYRFITNSRLLGLKRAGIIDAGLYDFCNQYYEQIVSELPHPVPRGNSKPSLITRYPKLEAHLRHVNQKPPSRKSSMLIPGHERWRATHASHKRWFPAAELDATRRYLKTKLERLDLYQEHAEPPESPPPKLQIRESSLYALFAAEIVASTVDAFDRLPDMSFDLIVVEEASQLGILKLLKVLTKVARARDARLPPPKIILSGDQRQLPPFLEEIQPDANYRGSDQRILKDFEPQDRKDVEQYQSYETAFEMICRRHPTRILPLTTQYRMQSQIGSVVNRLFYAEQEWVTTNNARGSGVVWLDTSGLKPKVEREPGGTSRFNETEIRVVSDLVRNLVAQRVNELEEILVVSPYVAQVSKLEDSLVGFPRVKVRTIDGCQGIEAANVIISFVSLNFSPGSDFVVDSKRMNVALSRARDSLYLVGSFSEISSSLRNLRNGEEYPHIAKLVKLFAPSGPLRNKLTPARYRQNQ
jgi:hypothetical protein